MRAGPLALALLVQAAALAGCMSPANPSTLEGASVTDEIRVRIDPVPEFVPIEWRESISRALESGILGWSAPIRLVGPDEAPHVRVGMVKDAGTHGSASHGRTIVIGLGDTSCVDGWTLFAPSYLERVAAIEMALAIKPTSIETSPDIAQGKVPAAYAWTCTIHIDRATLPPGHAIQFNPKLSQPARITLTAIETKGEPISACLITNRDARDCRTGTLIQQPYDLDDMASIRITCEHTARDSCDIAYELAYTNPQPSSKKADTTQTAHA